MPLADIRGFSYPRACQNDACRNDTYSLTRPSMYTVQFQGHKGWPAVLGMLGALYGIAAPYQSILPVKGAIAVGIVGAIVSAFSNKPGAPKDPVVTLHDAPSQATTPAAQ